MLKREVVEEIIGKGFADHLDEHVFKVTDKFCFTYREMIEELGCANFIAAVRLAKVLKKLGVESPFQLKQLDPFSLARCWGIGEAALFVAMCILDHADYNVQEWWGWNDNELKFSSFKAKAIRKSRSRKQKV